VTDDLAPEPPLPPALQRRPRDVSRSMRILGWQEHEAAALAAYASGLPISSAERPLRWRIREVEHLIALREISRLGRLPS
jgi:hypothetical protein